MERLPTCDYTATKITEETPHTVDSVHLLYESLEDQSFIYNRKCLSNGIKESVQLSIGHEDVSFAPPKKINTETSLKENSNPLIIMCPQDAVTSVRIILEEALDSIFEVTSNSTHNSQKKYDEVNENKSFSKVSEKSQMYMDYSDNNKCLPPSLNSSPSNHCLIKKENIRKHGNDSVNNGLDEITVNHVDSTTGRYKKNKLNSSILKNLLSGGSYFPPYLPKTQFQDPFSCIKKISNPSSEYDKNLTWDGDRKTFTSKSKKVATCDKNGKLPIGYCRNYQETSIIDEMKEKTSLEVADLLENDLKSTHSEKVNEWKINNAETEIITNILNLSVNDPTMNFSVKQSNVTSLVATNSLMTGFIDDSDILNTVQSSRNVSFTQSYKTVSSNEAGVLHFMKERGDLMRTISQEGRLQRELTSSYNIISSSEVNGDRTSSQNSSSLDNQSANYDEKVSVDLLPRFTMKCTKTVILENLGFGSYNNIQSPFKFQINRDTSGNTEKDRGIKSSTVVIGTEKTVSNEITTSDSALYKTVLSGQTKSSNGCIEDIEKLNSFDYSPTFSPYWLNTRSDQVQGNAKVVAEKASEKRTNEFGPSIGTLGCDSTESASNVDELEEIIEDSIKKFENFTADASILAVPLTAEKCCQTEVQEYQIRPRCKRCLELVEEHPEQIKKAKMNVQETLPETLNAHTWNGSFGSLGYDEKQNGCQTSPTATESIQMAYLDSSNTEGLFSLYSADNMFNKFDTTIVGGIDEIYEDKSLFDTGIGAENNLQRWNAKSIELDQEVPINPLANLDKEDDIIEESHT